LQTNVVVIANTHVDGKRSKKTDESFPCVLFPEDTVLKKSEHENHDPLTCLIPCGKYHYETKPSDAKNWPQQVQQMANDLSDSGKIEKAEEAIHCIDSLMDNSLLTVEPVNAGSAVLIPEQNDRDSDCMPDENILENETNVVESMNITGQLADIGKPNIEKENEWTSEIRVASDEKDPLTELGSNTPNSGAQRLTEDINALEPAVPVHIEELKVTNDNIWNNEREVFSAPMDILNHVSELMEQVRLESTGTPRENGHFENIINDNCPIELNNGDQNDSMKSVCEKSALLITENAPAQGSNNGVENNLKCATPNNNLVSFTSLAKERKSKTPINYIVIQDFPENQKELFAHNENGALGQIDTTAVSAAMDTKQWADETIDKTADPSKAVENLENSEEIKLSSVTSELEKSYCPDIWNTPYTPTTNFIVSAEPVDCNKAMDSKETNIEAEKPWSQDVNPEKPYLREPAEIPVSVAPEEFADPPLMESQMNSSNTRDAPEKPKWKLPRSKGHNVTFAENVETSGANKSANIAPVKQWSGIMKSAKLDLPPKIHSDPWGTIEMHENSKSQLDQKNCAQKRGKFYYEQLGEQQHGQDLSITTGTMHI